MKTYIVVAIMVCRSFYLHSQVNTIDSLQKVIDSSAKHATASLQDTILIKTHHQLAMAYYFQSDFKNSIEQANKVIDLSEKVKWGKGQVIGYQDISYSYFKLGKHKDVIQLNYKALVLAEQNQLLPQKLSSLRLIADAYNVLSQKDSAIVIYKKLIPIYQKLNLTNNLGACYLNLATTLKDVQNNTGIMDYYRKAENIFIAQKDNFWLGNAYNSMGDYYLKIQKMDSAFYYLNKSLFALKNDKNESLLTTLYGELAYTYAIRKDYRQAIFYGQKSLDLAQKADILEDIYWAYEALYLGNKGLGNDKMALLYHEKMLDTRTTMLQTDNKQQIENYQQLYENQKNIQQKTIENQQLTNKNQKNTLSFLIGLSLMFLGIGAMLWWNNRRLIKKNAEIVEAHFKGQKVERKRVAEELHDNLGSQLSAMRWSILAMNKDLLNPTEREIYDNVMEMVDESYNQVRNLSHNLSPDSLEAEGLVKTLGKMMDKLNKNNKIRFELITNNLPEKLDKKIEFELYSILLELINNIIKHSQATKATISINQVDSQTQIHITDNGKGYIETDLNNGHGLLNIQKRIQQFNGKFDKMTTAQGTDLMIVV